MDADGSRYLLSDHAGMLHLLVITHDKERFVDVLSHDLISDLCVAYILLCTIDILCIQLERSPCSMSENDVLQWGV